MPGCWMYPASLAAGQQVHLFAVGDDELSLIDTGFAGHPASVIAPHLAARGRRLAEVRQLLTTHVHVDHAGGHAATLRHADATVLAHQGDAAGCGDAVTFGRSGQEIVGALEVVGRPDLAKDRRQLVETNWSGGFPVHHWLSDGERLNLDGHAVTVVHTPGHTMGSVAYVFADHGVAIVGDSVQGWGAGAAAWPLVLEPVAYLSSLERIARLALDMLVLSHAFTSSRPTDGTSPVRRGHDVPRILRDSRDFLECVLTAANDVVAAGVREPCEAVPAVITRVDHAVGRSGRPAGPFALATALACVRAQAGSGGPTDQAPEHSEP